MPLSQPNGYTDMIMLKPDRPKSDSRTYDPALKWLFLDKNLFDPTGKTCDKIGISYEAFYLQQDKCFVYDGTCLGNQIEDYFQKNLRLLETFKDTEDFLLAYKLLPVLKNNEILLRKKVEGNFPTMLTLEIRADDMIFYVNV